MSQHQPIQFSETQSLRQWRVRITLAYLPVALIFITCRQVVWHKPWSMPALSNGGLIFLTLLVLTVYIRLITVKLVTELRPHEIVVRLPGLWRQRQIPLEQIRSAGAVTCNPVAHFGGYGMGTDAHETAYIARGPHAVKLSLASGEKILIGSQNPAELAQKIIVLRDGQRAV